MKIKLGIAPIAWSNDDMPELGGDTPIEKCLEEAGLAGFSGIELGGKFPRNPGIVKFLLEKFNLSLPGGWYGSKLRERSVKEEWELMKDQIELLRLINSDVFIFADVSGSIQGNAKAPLSSRPKLSTNEWKNYCNKISEISNRLEDIGLPMSFHAHMGTIIQSEKDIEKFLDLTNEKTFLLYDTGHLLFAQVNYEKLIKKYISRINHIHCKDIRKQILQQSLDNDLSFRDSFLKGVFTVPGDGCINYNNIIKILFQNNYEKWLVIEAEQDPIKANPFDYAKLGFKYLKGVVNKNGYTI
tara:strand:- start:901 stop:1794 length:894 start_codon:yes stop_codon:yes gene_type:complete